MKGIDTMKNYDERIQWYRDYMIKNENATNRSTREYVDYLKSWFGAGPCDGVPDFATRIKWKCEPMPTNVYLYE